MGKETAMIVCPNCNYQNPDGATQCEACYTPLPATTSCPQCGATVQTDATFCGQCGYNLQAQTQTAGGEAETSSAGISTAVSSPEVPPTIAVPDPVPVEPLVQPDPLVAAPSPVATTPAPQPVPVASPEVSSSPAAPDPSPTPAAASSSRTQLQVQKAKLLHVQTNTLMELPQGISVIHVGKPNDNIPPDIDVSGFPNSEIVSRIHADIRVEGDAYYIEDVGSSNGTYINNMPLRKGDRHRLRAGDRIALGKGDLVTLLFQLS